MLEIGDNLASLLGGVLVIGFWAFVIWRVTR